MAPTVLIVDDHAGFRSAARVLLEGLGYAVREAPDGASALADAARSHPDLVLLDVGLPDVDGFEVEKGLRAAGVRSHVLMTSSRAEETYSRRLRSSQSIGFIAKGDLTGEAIRRMAGAA